MRMILAVGVLSRVQPSQLKCRACRVVAGPCAVVHDMRVSTDSPWGAVVWVLYFWHHSVSGGGAAACPIQLGGGDGLRGHGRFRIFHLERHFISCPFRSTLILHSSIVRLCRFCRSSFFGGGELMSPFLDSCE